MPSEPADHQGSAAPTGDVPARGVAGVAAADAQRVALVCEGTRVTYGQLDTAANVLATRYAAAGVAPGDRVAVMLGNGLEVFAVWCAVARLGALIVPVSTRLTAPEVAYLIEDSGATLFVHDGSPPSTDVMSLTDVAQDRVDDIDWPEMARLASEDPVAPVREDFLGTPATTMTYTSGTTGRPKGIARLAPPAARHTPPSPFATFWGFGADDVHLMCGPVYHTAPSAYAHMTLGEGGRVVIMRKWDAELCLTLIETEKVTTTQMVPANFIRILEAQWRGRDVSSIRKVLHAAAPCPVDVKRRIIEVFPAGTVWEYYGASEGMASVIPPDEWLRKPGSVGRPFPGITVRICDDDGNELPAGEIGSIYISSFSGQRFEYHNAPEKTAQAWRDGFFTVGDLGSLDEDGYLFLADRRTDLVLSGGVNVYPAEVEAALVEDDDVVDAAVIGLPDERMGQRVHAVVELRAGTPRDADALLARLAGRLADYKRPRTVEFVDELPREPNGKVLKTRLRAERATPDHAPNMDAGRDPAKEGV